MSGPSTRTIHAGVPPGEQGEPLLPGPVLAAPYHLRGAKDAAEYGYGRDGNPSWTAPRARARRARRAARRTVFASGMAAVTAVLFSTLRSGDVLVACGDGYPGIRGLARERLEPLGVEDAARARPPRSPRPSRAPRSCGSRRPRTRGWTSSTSPRSRRPRTPRARCWRSTTPSAPRSASSRSPYGADFAMLLGHQEPVRALRRAARRGLGGRARARRGAAALAHAARARSRAASRRGSRTARWPRSALRLERSSANAAAVAALLRAREDVTEVSHPGGELAERQMAFFGPLVGFALRVRRARPAVPGRLLARLRGHELRRRALDRRAARRWGTDAVGEGFIRFSAGCEDEADLLADVSRALDASA